MPQFPDKESQSKLNEDGQAMLAILSTMARRIYPETAEIEFMIDAEESVGS